MADLIPIPMGIPWDPWDPSLSHSDAHLYSAGAVGSAVRGVSAPTEGGEGLGHIAYRGPQLVGDVIGQTSPCLHSNHILNIHCDISYAKHY